MGRVKCVLGLLLAAGLLTCMGGCWDYKDIKKLNIVTGIAVDRDPEGEGYLLSFELMDLSQSIKDGGLQSIVVQGRGKNISEAVNSVRYYLDYSLYFGNSQFLLIQEELAREEGLSALLDWFSREYEIKDTTYVCVASTEQACDVFAMEPLDNNIVSYEMLEILNYDHKSTVFIEPMPLYRIHGRLRGEGRSLTLPVIGKMRHEAEDREIPMLYGMALFDGEHLVATMPVEESRYLLFPWQHDRMATLTYALPELEGGYITVDVVQSDTDLDYSREGEDFCFTIKVNVRCVLEELTPGEYLAEAETKDVLEEELAEEIGRNLREVLERCQKLGADAPELGRMVYEREPGLWRDISEDWGEIFGRCRLDIQAEASIENPGITQKS